MKNEADVTYKFTALFNIKLIAPGSIKITFPSLPSPYTITAGTSCILSGASNIVKSTTTTLTSLSYLITLNTGASIAASETIIVSCIANNPAAGGLTNDFNF